MRSENELKKYISIFLTTIMVAVILLLLLAEGAVVALDRMNDIYMPYYKAGVKGISAPWYDQGYHIVDEGVIPELNKMNEGQRSVVAIGSSLSVVSFQQDMAALPGGYVYDFLVCGNGCYKSDIILYNLAKKAGAIGADDIVKLEVSFSTFRNPGTTIVETTLDKWKKYGADEEGNIHENTKLLTPVYYLNTQLIKLQNVWELAGDIINQKLSMLRGQAPDDMIVPGNFRNNYFAYDAVAANCNQTEEMREELKALIDEIDSEHMLVVELSPLPAGLAETEYGQEFVHYVDNQLIPYLDDVGIRYVDYRYDYSDDEFSDGVHLGYDAGIRYTQKLNRDMAVVISRNQRIEDDR